MRWLWLQRFCSLLLIEQKSFAKLHVCGCLQKKTNLEQPISIGRESFGNISDQVPRVVSGGWREVQTDKDLGAWLIGGRVFILVSATVFQKQSQLTWNKRSHVLPWFPRSVESWVKWTWFLGCGCCMNLACDRSGTPVPAVCSGLPLKHYPLLRWRTEPGSTAFSHSHIHLAPLLTCLSCCSLSPLRTRSAGLLFSFPAPDTQHWGLTSLGDGVAVVSMWSGVHGHSSCDAPEITKTHKKGFGPTVRRTKVIAILLSPSEWQFECRLVSRLVEIVDLNSQFSMIVC